MTAPILQSVRVGSDGEPLLVDGALICGPAGETDQTYAEFEVTLRRVEKPLPVFRFSTEGEGKWWLSGMFSLTASTMARLECFRPDGLGRGDVLLRDVPVRVTVAEIREGDDEPLDPEARAWKGTAAQYGRNEEYYRDLLDRCAQVLGPEVFTADDGGVHDTPLRAKIPELVERLAARVRELEAPHADAIARAQALANKCPICAAVAGHPHDEDAHDKARAEALANGGER